MTTATRTVEQQDPIETVTLVMTAAEADTMGIILRKIGGHPAGRRGDCTRILRALESAGINYYGLDTPESKLTQGSIMFPTPRSATDVC